MTKTTLLLGLIVGTVVLTGLSLDDAEAAVFAKYDGIDGESKDANHDKWIDVLSVDWGAHKKNAGETTSKRGSAVIVEDLKMTFEYEKASPKLQEKCLKGEIIPKLEIEQTATYAGSRATYLKYELTNVLVTSYDVSASGNDEAGRPLMHASVNFETIKVTYTEFDDEGSAVGNSEYAISVKKNGKVQSEPTRTDSSTSNSFDVPDWYYTNINWQHMGLISADEVHSGLEYLKQQNILTI